MSYGLGIARYAIYRLGYQERAPVAAEGVVHEGDIVVGEVGGNAIVLIVAD